MASLWQKALMYLGLVDEDTVEQEPEPAAPVRNRNAVRTVEPQGRQERVAGRRVEPPPATGRAHAPTAARSTGAVRAVPTMEAQSDVVEPVHFDDAKLLADRIRDRVPVVLNMRNTDPEMVRRLVDFCTGLTYALDGSMRKIDEGVILVLPPRVSLGREEKRRLAEMGLYAVGDEQT
jgi:cell division inhibitor SepF